MYIKCKLKAVIATISFIVASFFVESPVYASSTEPTRFSNIDKMKAGNEYFASYSLRNSKISNKELIKYLAKYGQTPCAIIITCSDARISPERIFNGQIGDFFIIRTAGNIVSDIELGSIEYAVMNTGATIILIMGHDHCGAIHSAMEIDNSNDVPEFVGKVVDAVRPAVNRATKETKDKTRVALLAENYNISTMLEKIQSSPVVKQSQENGKLTVIGAKYELSTGKVTFF